MEQKPTHATSYQPFNIKDTTWWGQRELGSPDDPYNQIPKLKPTDPEYDEYIETAEKNFEVLLQEYENEEGWNLSKEENDVRVEWKALPQEDIYCCRGAGIIRATAEVIRLHLVQIDLRQFWDPMFEGGHYKLEVCENVRVVYYSFKAPWPVTSRDFYVVAGEKITEDGIVISAVNSVEREDCPVKDGYVRAKLKASGFVIKPLENDDDGTPRCMVTYLVQCQPMGWIPTMIVNTVNIEQGMVIHAIRNAIGLTQVMIEEAFMKLFELPKEQYNAKMLKRLIYKVIDNNNGKKDMLYDPFCYVIAGTRRPERTVEELIEEQGKDVVLKKLWDGAQAYVKSIGKKDLYDAAAKFFGA
jgi:hypothetical protein